MTNQPVPRWRRIEQGTFLALLLVLLVSLSGCATWDHQKERRELLRGPKQVSLADAHGFSASKKNAQTEWDSATPKDATKADIIRFIDEAVAQQTINCRNYFSAVTLASRRGQLARSEFNIGAALVTALSAIAQASANFMAVLGIAITGVNQFGDAYADVLIEAPETPAIRSRVLELMEVYATSLRTDAGAGLSYPQARVRLAAHEDICSPGSVRELVNASVRGADLSVRPSGAITTKVGP